MSDVDSCCATSAAVGALAFGCVVVVVVLVMYLVIGIALLLI